MSRDEPLVGPLGSPIGSFRLGPERVVFVGYLLGSITPAAFDFGTGRLRGFALRPDGSLTAGPRLQVHEPTSGGQWRDRVRLIADFLAGSGVAALAYDKRGTGASTGDWDRASFPQLAEDALAGMRFLQSHPAVDGRRVGFFGSSQGGWIVPIAASRAPDAAFAVLHSAPAVPVWRQNLNNVEHSMRAYGLPEEVIRRAVALADGLHGLWRTGEGWEALAAAWRAAEGEPWLEYVGPLADKPTPEQAERWRRNPDSDLDRDPLPFLERTSCPVLALYGAEDTIVAPEANPGLLAEALRRGGNADVEVRVFAGADHLGVVRRERGRRLAFGDATRFEPGYFREMAAWLASRAGATALW